MFTSPNATTRKCQQTRIAKQPVIRADKHLNSGNTGITAIAKTQSTHKLDLRPFSNGKKAEKKCPPSASIKSHNKDALWII